MTVIRPNSISGITSITAQANEINVFKSDGTLAGLSLNGVNVNTTTGISTYAALNVTGNISIGGTLTYQDVTNVDSVGIVTARAGIKVLAGGINAVGVITATDGMFIPDNKVLHLGNFSGSGTGDLQIYHDTNHSYVKDVGTGDLVLQTQGGHVMIKYGSDTMAFFQPSNKAELYFANSPKLATTNTGITVTGTVAATSFTGDGSNLTGLPAGVTINNNANNRIITGNTGTTLDAESTLTYDGNTLKFGGGSAPSNTTYYNDIVIDNSDTSSGAAGGAGIKLYSGNQTWGGIIFGDSDADQVGYVKYSHTDNYLTFAASGSERLRIESTGGGTISAKNCTGAFAVPLGTTAQRPTGTTGMVRFNTTTNKLEVYNGTDWKVVNFQADPFGLSYLVIGGGGAGGGNYRGGGGGAGGYRTNWNSENQGGGQSSGATFTVNPNASPTYSIVVGDGGTGASNTHGGSGGQSKFDTITADGGGGGGHYSTKEGQPSPGNGSGGGGGSPNRAGGSSGTYGYDGGQGGADNQQCGGGGGGAALVGYAGNNSGTGGDGGTALASTITGSSVLRAGGGGGGAYGGGNNIPVGGGGGAGNGRYGNNPYQNGLPAGANTGSGGGGASGSSNATGGNGGSGVVILRYPSTANATYSSGVTKTTTTVGSDTVDVITATSGSGQTVSFSA